MLTATVTEIRRGSAHRPGIVVDPRGPSPRRRPPLTT